MGAEVLKASVAVGSIRALQNGPAGFSIIVPTCYEQENPEFRPLLSLLPPLTTHLLRVYISVSSC